MAYDWKGNLVSCAKGSLSASFVSKYFVSSSDYSADLGVLIKLVETSCIALFLVFSKYKNGKSWVWRIPHNPHYPDYGMHILYNIVES